MAEIAQIKFTRQSKKYLKTLLRSGEEKLFKNLELFFNGEALLVAGHISKELLSGQLLNRRTGTLARSMTGRGVRVGGIPGMRVGVFRGPALAYAGIQEHGGTIVAKDKLLAIPAKDGPAVTPAGVHRYDSPRQFPGKLTFIPFKRGGNVVGGLYTEDDVFEVKQGSRLFEVKAAYLLMRKVTIKPKHYLRDGVRSQLPLVAEALAQFLAIQFSSLTEAQKKDALKKQRSSNARRQKRSPGGKFI